MVLPSDAVRLTIFAPHYQRSARGVAQARGAGQAILRHVVAGGILSILPAMALRTHKPIVGFAAFSGSGKTTLLRKLIPLLVDQGIRVALIKHAHHAFDIDIPGKDSYELRQAGASQVLVASDRREALIIEKPHSVEPRLDQLVSRCCFPMTAMSSPWPPTPNLRCPRIFPFWISMIQRRSPHLLSGIYSLKRPRPCSFSPAAYQFAGRLI